MGLIRSILVPLDGSPFSEQALPWAVAVADKTGAMLQLAGVHHPVPALATALEVPAIETELCEEVQRREAEYLRGTLQRVEQMANIPVTGTMLDGAVAPALADHATRTASDLVIMTTHGRGPFNRFWLGSVADQLVRESQTPLLLVRPREKVAETFRGIRRILVPVDGSAFAEQGLELALSLGRTFGAAYTLLFVVEPPMPVVDAGVVSIPLTAQYDDELRAAAERYVFETIERLRSAGYTADGRVVSVAGVAHTILEQADILDADVIALATHGAGGARRMLVGSVADKVVRGSHRPVLLVRGTQAKH